ncbi:hypothetical protein ANO14919_000050 [Xylariales sp. No.14919]|nr:hypothetical protein ANO14919_000050 [Xylariales sp. No.14919]
MLHQPRESAMPSDDIDRKSLIIGLTWALTSTCLIITGARLYLRLKILKSLGIDDWLMFVAAVGQAGYQVCITVAYSWGLGAHDRDLTFNELVNVLKWVWISVLPGTVSTLIARISIAILLLRLFGTKIWFRRFILLYTPVQTIVAVGFIVIVWTQVSPIEGLWNPLVEARRWDPRIQQYVAYFAQSLLTFADLTYVLFPVLIIWRLHMPTRRKLGLVILLALSLVTLTASILKTVTSQTSSSSAEDVQYNASLGALFAALEQSLVIIMGCVPPLRPLGAMTINSLRSFSSAFTSLVDKAKYGESTGSSQHHERGGSAYYDLERMDTRKLGVLHMAQNAAEHSFMVTQVDASADSISDAHNIRRTDQFSVSFG